MPLTRRGFAQGSAALAAAAIMPSLPAAGQATPKQAAPKQDTLRVRRSIGDLIRENGPIVESYRRAVDVMMQRDVTDKTSWWFQANIHDLPDDDLAKLRSLAPYWRQCPHKNYHFLSWHRAYLHFFERIVRKASGDPNFTLPYWAYEDPQQATLPVAFLPDNDEIGKDATTPALSRRNPLARANRLEHVDRRWIGLGSVASDVSVAMALDRFATDDKLDALKVFGGVRAAGLRDEQAAGAVEATPHNLVHKTIGLQGDMGSPDTAARDPIFWLHHANIDRLWAKWTDPARGRIPPVDDEVWMKTKFTFVDEDGRDRVMTGEEVLDTQFQLGYRYDDDPQRTQQLDMKVVIARAPAGGPTAKGVARMPNESVVVARSGALAVAARESQVALAAVARPAAPSGAMPGGGAPRLRVVLRDVVAGARTPPYDVYLVQDGNAALAAGANAVRIGGLDLFGGAGHGAHAQHGGATLAFDASDAVAQLTGGRGFDASRLRVAIVRRGFPVTTGGEFVPDDPDPPRIGAIELIQS
jgi:hypothetical protein